MYNVEIARLDKSQTLDKEVNDILIYLLSTYYFVLVEHRKNLKFNIVMTAST